MGNAGPGRRGVGRGPWRGRHDGRPKASTTRAERSRIRRSLRRLAAACLRRRRGLGLGPRVGTRVSLQRRMAVHAGPRADHAAEDRAGPDRSVVGTRGPGVNGPIGNEGERGRRRGLAEDPSQAAVAGDVRRPCVLAGYLPFTGFPRIRGLQLPVLPLPCPGHAQLHLSAGQVAATGDLDDRGTPRQLVEPERSREVRPPRS